MQYARGRSGINTQMVSILSPDSQRQALRPSVLRHLTHVLDLPVVQGAGPALAFNHEKAKWSQNAPDGPVLRRGAGLESLASPAVASPLGSWGEGPRPGHPARPHRGSRPSGGESEEHALSPATRPERGDSLQLCFYLEG